MMRNLNKKGFFITTSGSLCHILLIHFLKIQLQIHYIRLFYNLESCRTKVICDLKFLIPNWRGLLLQCNSWKMAFYSCFQEAFVKKLMKKLSYLNTNFQNLFQHVQVSLRHHVLLYLSLMYFSVSVSILFLTYRCVTGKLYGK